MSRTTDLMTRLAADIEAPRTPRERVKVADALLREARTLRSSGLTTETLEKAGQLEGRAGRLLVGLKPAERDRLRAEVAAEPATTAQSKNAAMNALIRRTASPTQEDRP